MGAFWSLILYDAKTFWLVANPINRYEVASHTDGLIYGANGIADDRHPARQAELLLGQRAAFPNRRIPADPPHLHPETAIFNGAWTPPPLQQTA